MKRCAKCNALVEDQYELCFRCGSVDFVSAEAAPAAAPPADQTAPAAPVEMFTPPAASAAPEAPKPPKKKKTGLVIGIVCGVAVIAIVLGIVFGGKKKETPPTVQPGVPAVSAGEPAAEGEEPFVIGSSPVVFKYVGDVQTDSEYIYSQIVYSENGRTVICDPFGVRRLQDSYDYYSVVDSLKQIFVVRNDAAAPNRFGLVCSDGTVYIPCSAAEISRLSSRYYRVKYADREVEKDSKEAFVRGVYGKDREMHNYTGYAIVYDVVARKFLADTKISTPGYGIYGGKDGYIYVKDEKGHATAIYNSEGKSVNVLDDVFYYTYKGYAYKPDYAAKTTTIYDPEGNLIKVVPKIVDTVYDLRYCIISESTNGTILKYICDLDGNKICDIGFASVYEYADQLFRCKMPDSDKQCLVNTDGTVMYENEVFYISFGDLCDGFAYIRPTKETYAMMYPDGTLVDFGTSRFDSACQYSEKDDGTTDVFIYAKKGMVNYPFKKAFAISKFLLKVRSADDKFGLLDVFTGEMLLEPEYVKMEYLRASDCVYALDGNGTWKVFSIHENSLDAAKKVQTTILTALAGAFKSAGINATIDEKRGQVMLDSGVLFANDKSDLTADGKAYLQKFIKVYTSVVLDPRYSGYVDSVVVKGHTDTNGSREHNLELSQARADNVLAYTLTPECGGEGLRDIATAVGVAYDDPIYNPDGSVNMDASRRVSFEIVVVTDISTEEES